MRKPLVAANWKMHGSKAFIESYFHVFNQRVQGLSEVEVAIFPPSIYIPQAVAQAADNTIVGGQNISQNAEGAFTGEISAQMLADNSATHVLVGHSERRSLYGESDELAGQKFLTALNYGLKPIFCVGESLQDRESGKTFSVVNRQLQAAVDAAGLEALSNSIVAYEPCWAIGTGKTATPDQAQEVHAYIREFLGEGGQSTRILYGGSVKSTNAEALFSQPDIDGGLVGGASLDANEFAAICEKAQTK